MAPSILNPISLIRRRKTSQAQARHNHPPTEEDQLRTLRQQHQQQQILYPPAALLSTPTLLDLLTQIQDQQLLCGSVLKRPTTNKTTELPFTFPIGITIFPTPFPRRPFYRAVQDLRGVYDELYAQVSCDEDWLRRVTEPLVRAGDELPGCLWGCFDLVRQFRHQQQQQRSVEEGREEEEEEEVGLGIWRSDYMLELGAEELELKQVEFNTISCAGGLHSHRSSAIHRYLAASGAYYHHHHPDEEAEEEKKQIEITLERLPTNKTIDGIVDALAAAHSYYLSRYSLDPESSCGILMPVQPRNVNVADERPIEYGLLQSPTQIKCHRIEWQDLLPSRIKLDCSSRRLLFRRTPQSDEWTEIGVVYFRAGHDVHEYYNDQGSVSLESSGAKARILIEKSRAIKCPTLLGHISTFKIVQQALTRPGAVERFLGEDGEKVGLVRKTFKTILSSESDSVEIKRLLSDRARIKDWIMKSSLEGGGHGVFGEDIIHAVKKMDDAELQRYIFMERIRPPKIYNALMSLKGLYTGGVISELGVFGACLFVRRCRRKSASKSDCEILSSKLAGCSLKTKADFIDEMSVVKGFGCFDSPLLLGDDEFLRISNSLSTLNDRIH